MNAIGLEVLRNALESAEAAIDVRQDSVNTSRKEAQRAEERLATSLRERDALVEALREAEAK